MAVCALQRTGYNLTALPALEEPGLCFKFPLSIAYYIFDAVLFPKSAGAGFWFSGVGVVDFGVAVIGGIWCRGGGWGKKSRCRHCPPPQHSR